MTSLVDEEIVALNAEIQNLTNERAWGDMSKEEKREFLVAITEKQKSLNFLLAQKTLEDNKTGYDYTGALALFTHLVYFNIFSHYHSAVLEIFVLVW